MTGGRFELPAFVSAHSHAFQRALRNRTERSTVPGSFWSWREKMYALSASLTPESIYDFSRLAFAELALHGVAAVGEFHYVHHQAGGTPYGDRVIMADAVIRAARDVGLQITLLRVLYQRAGAKSSALPEQRRFCDLKIEDAFADIDELQKRYSADEGVAVGIAPHSLRAVPAPWVLLARDFAKNRGIPIHMHVAEQRRELEECVSEYGETPVRWLSENSVLGENFTAVHATHLDDEEITMLGKSKSSVCICRTTERNLGDGLCRAGDLFKSGASICVGADSHCSSDPFEELRAIELDERSRTESRCVAATASDLLSAGSENGYKAIGLDGENDRIVLRPDIAVSGFDDDIRSDSVVFSGNRAMVSELRVLGKRVVCEHALPDLAAIEDAFTKRIRALNW